MDRPTFLKIVGIVKEMNAQGLSTSEIESNLKQMGVSDEDIEEIMREAKPEASVPEIHEKTKQVVQLLETGEHLKPAIEKLEEQKEDLERVHTHLGEVHEKQLSSVQQLAEIKAELDEIKRELEELKPLVASIKRLDENLIKLNRKMLVRLGGEEAL